MKYIFTVILCTIFYNGHSQFSIGSNTYPKTFDQLIYKNYNSNAYFNLGDSGANALWDFSTFTLLTKDSAIEDYLNISGTYQPTHPTANTMVKTIQYNYTSYRFYNNKINSGTIDWVGTQNATPPSYHVYSNAIADQVFPKNYKQVRTDAFKYRSQGFSFDSGTYQGAIKITCPGWGRVKISNTLFYDSCLMELRILTGSSPSGSPYKYLEANFYSSKYKGALVKVYLGYYYDGSNFIPTTQSVSLQMRPVKAPQASSINEVLNNNPVVYPNPFTHNLYVQTTSNNITEIQILNGLGQLVFTQSSLDNTSLQFNLEALPAGIYNLILKDNLGNQTVRQLTKVN